MTVFSKLTLLIALSEVVLAAAPADVLWTAHYVVTMDGSRRVIENGAIAIQGERILAVGPRAELERQYQPKQRRDAGDAVLLPGLVNTHTHAAMSLFRGIADDMRLEDWLNKFIFPAEAKNVTADFVRWGTRLACLEMALSGTTTFTDMYYFEDVVAEATKEAGLRGVLGETIIQFPVADAKTPADSLAFTEKFIQRYRKDSLIVPAIAPHALYTNSPETLQAARALANKYDVPLLIHLSETRTENTDMRAKYNGKSPTQELADIGALNGRTLAAHGVWLDEADQQLLAQYQTGVAHCPSSNMKLASGIAPVVSLQKHGIHVGLGPDGPAGSNNDFNMFEEMNLAANLQKVATLDPQALPAQTALEMATIEGAAALGLNKEIGSLEPGKRADIIAVSLTEPHAVPLYNIYSQLVYAIKASDVRDVMVNGRWIVRDRQMLTLDRAAVLARARQYRIDIQKSLTR